MNDKHTLRVGTALLIAGLAFSSPSYSQEQKAPAMTPPTGQGMTMPPGQGMMMPPEMMARMNKMMDQCEKMMGAHDMHKNMRRHKRS